MRCKKFPKNRIKVAHLSIVVVAAFGSTASAEPSNNIWPYYSCGKHPIIEGFNPPSIGSSEWDGYLIASKNFCNPNSQACLISQSVLASGVIYNHDRHGVWKRPGEEIDSEQVVSITGYGTYFVGSSRFDISKDGMITPTGSCRRVNPGIGEDVFTR